MVFDLEPLSCHTQPPVLGDFSEERGRDEKRTGASVIRPYTCPLGAGANLRESAGQPYPEAGQSDSRAGPGPPRLTLMELRCVARGSSDAGLIHQLHQGELTFQVRHPAGHTRHHLAPD